MRTSTLTLVLALCLALPLAGRAAPLTGPVKYGGPTDTKTTNRQGRTYDSSSYRSGSRAAPGSQKAMRAIGPLPRGAQNATDDVRSYPPAPQAPRKAPRAVGPLPRSAQPAQ